MKFLTRLLVPGLTAIAILAWLLSHPITAQQPPQASDPIAVTYSPHAASAECHMNMGPIGATAWMRGYHFVVMSIQHGSPGHGRLMLGDVVIGLENQTFGPDVDPRMTLGNAIDRAQASGQPLALAVLREGKATVVKIDLPQWGAFGPTWPENCAKSDAILEQAAQSLLDTQMPNGDQITDGATGTFFSGLLFLATGEAKYLDAARRAAYNAARMDYTTISYNNWAMGYGGILLAEYYLATGDDTVLPKLAELASMIAAGQMRCGTWGHKSPAEGYGALNQPGITCAIALALARECGVPIDEAALNRALDFFARFAATGAVPYGDHFPSNGLDDNGRNATAAILFHLVGRDEEARAFVAPVAESYWNREQGHTGGFFSMMWGPLAVQLAGDATLQKFLDYQKWYYELIRRWNGELTFLPYKEALTRFDDSTYIGITTRVTTGGLGLVFAMPRHKLRILNAPTSVFGAGDRGALAEARALYLKRDWKACDAALAAIESSSLKSADEKRWLEQLIAARAMIKASTDRLLMEIDCNLTDGAPYRAFKQFEAMKTCLGLAADERFAAIEARFAEPNTVWCLREGEEYYQKLGALIGVSVKGWVPQGRQAQAMLEGVPSARLPFWEPLSATSGLVPQTWRSKHYANDQQLESGWYEPGFDDSQWIAGQGIQTYFTAPQYESLPAGPIAARRTFTIDDPIGKALRVRLQTVREARTKVYLNGKLIVDVERGQRGGYATIMLSDGAMALLKRGENVLAVTSTVQGKAGNHLDVGLEINRDGADRRHLPIDRASHLIASSLPEGDTSLKVDETAREFSAALRESYMNQSVPQLVKGMEDIVAFYRSMVADSLVAKGLSGVEPAAVRLAARDWKARATALDVMGKAFKKFTGEQDQAGLSFVVAQTPAIRKLVADEHFWVRVMACNTLGVLGKEAAVAIPDLLKATDDGHEWVRQSALAALKQVGADTATMHTAARTALSHANSSFGITSQSLSVVKLAEGDAQAKLDILVAILRTPAEGGGGESLNEAIDLGCKLDPDGKVMVGVLMEAASDATHLSRQRANPRGKAIKALGAYGRKAIAAVEVLKAIIADESDRASKQHEAAMKALEQIAG